MITLFTFFLSFFSHVFPTDVQTSRTHRRKSKISGNGLMVLVPVVPASSRPCQLWRGVVRSPGWNADSWICVIMGRRPELPVHGAEVCKRSMHAAKNRGGHRDSVPPRAQRSGAGRGSKLRAEDGSSEFRGWQKRGEQYRGFVRFKLGSGCRRQGCGVDAV